MTNIKAAAEQIIAHRVIGPLVVSDSSLIEHTWTHKASDLDCLFQARPDLVCHGGRVVIELKTCQDASPEAFAGDIGKYGYDIQAALYRDVLKAEGVPVEAYIWVAVELSAPWLCACYSPDADTIEAGRTAYKNAAMLWKTCVETGKWPGYESKIKTIGMRPWNIKQRMTMREGE